MKVALRLVALAGLVLLVLGPALERSDVNARAAANELPPVPSELVGQVLGEFEDATHVVILARGGCGAPFGILVSYLQRMQAVVGVAPTTTVAIVTGRDERRALRNLEQRYGVQVVENDEFVSAFQPYGSAVIVTAAGTGQEAEVHQFSVVLAAPFVAELDGIFGVVGG